MRKLVLTLLGMALLPSIALAAVECTDRPDCWPDGSAMRTGLLLVEQQRVVDAALTRRHRELVKWVEASAIGETRTDGRLLNALRAQQAAWLKYRTEECELVGSLTGAGGSWPSTYANRCELNHTEQRLRRVRSALRCVRKISPDMRLVEQNNCLQQLAPLTNK